MIRWFPRRILCAAVLLAPLSGCSFYLNRPVTFQVRDAETKKPIEGATIEGFYIEALLVARTSLTGWGPTKGVTDRDGKLTLLVDPYKEGFQLNVKAKGYLDYRSGTWATRADASRKRFEWKNDHAVEMYAEPAAELELVFPEGYRGVVLLRFSPTEKLPNVQGQRFFRYDVPPSGVVEIQESGLLRRITIQDRVRASLKDGTPIPTVTWGMVNSRGGVLGPKDHAIALRFVELDRERNTWIYLLGTKQEADAVRKSKLPPTVSEADQRDLDRLMKAWGK